MRTTKSLLLGISALALATSAAFAGEDSTHRWHGTGPEYQQSIGGLELFSDADAVGADQFSEPKAAEPLVLESYDVYYIDPTQPLSGAELSSDDVFVTPMDVESIVLVPTIDTELPEGS